MSLRSSFCWFSIVQETKPSRCAFCSRSLSQSVPTKRRLALSGAFLITYAAAHLAFSSLNYLRYGEFCVAKLGNAHLPFYRLFVQEHLISPGNGPASGRLASFVAEKVLTNPVYRDYEITLDVFFRCSTQRMFNSLIYAFQKDGSAGDFAILRNAGIESIRQDLKGSLLRYSEHLITVFDYRDRKPFRISNLRDLSRAFVREREQHYARYTAKGLPLPTEGDLLPSMPLFAAREERRDENWFGLQRAVKEWKLHPSRLFEPDRRNALWNQPKAYSQLQLVLVRCALPCFSPL